jgi:hypothetical protein
MLSEKWRPFIGWTAVSVQPVSDAGRGFRLKGTQGTLSFFLVRSGNRVGYDTFQSGTTNRVFRLVFDGTTVWFEGASTHHHAVTADLAKQFVTESYILTNAIADLPARPANTGLSADEIGFIVRPPGGAPARIILNNTSGACKFIDVVIGDKSIRYTPTKYNQIYAQTRFYDTWERGSDAPIVISSFEPVAKIYKAELAP